MLPPDPVFEEEESGHWYFWDEAWFTKYGPYDSEEKARSELDRYCKEVLGYEE